MHKISLLIVFAYLALALASCSKKPLYKSKTLEPVAEMPAAGSIEWIDRLQYNSEYKIAYGYFNDETDLVIRTMVTDRSTIMKMFATGFTIRIDTTGKKNPQYSIKYPLAQGMQNMPRQEGRNQPKNNTPNEMNPAGNMDTRLKTALNRIEIEGFDDEAINGTQLNSRTGDGITAWIQVDSTLTMYYELKIPLRDILTNGYTSKSTLSIGLESGEIEMPSNGPPANISMQPGGGKSGGGGGRQNEGMRPGGAEMQQQRAEMQSMSQAIKIWIKRIELQ